MTRRPRDKDRPPQTGCTDMRGHPGCLDESQLNRLTNAFKAWLESAVTDHTRRVRGRYWLTFILLRHTGARIGEILSLDDGRDIDLNRGEVRIPSASRTSGSPLRTIPVPPKVVQELIHYLNSFPMMKGKVFALDQGNFRREFYRRAEEAQIPRELSHPHILRHTRAMELLDAGVPLGVVRDILGHALMSTTAIYLRQKRTTIRTILEDKGFL